MSAASLPKLLAYADAATVDEGYESARCNVAQPAREYLKLRWAWPMILAISSSRRACCSTTQRLRRTGNRWKMTAATIHFVPGSGCLLREKDRCVAVLVETIAGPAEDVSGNAIFGLGMTRASITLAEVFSRAIMQTDMTMWKVRGRCLCRLRWRFCVVRASCDGW